MPNLDRTPITEIKGGIHVVRVAEYVKYEPCQCTAEGWLYGSAEMWRTVQALSL